MAFGYMLYDALSSWMLEGAAMEKALLTTYVLSAQVLFMCSSCFHLFHCIGPTQYSQLARCDYTGISILIAGSYYMPIYYLFICRPIAFAGYASGITLVGATCIYVSYSPRFEKPGYEGLRAGVFVAFGLVCVVMGPHLFTIYDYEVIAPLITATMRMGACYLIGVVFYIFQIPERFIPGAFDLHFHSHVIWHFFVVFAAYQHFYVCKFAFESAPLLLSSCAIA
eukprot:TRINITY_DN26607_c0_g1_i1.p1 TRINITY_DN26607_c0_g1~~TRINITY_DN26607_c0_g1_i1.p1  ORF type:complete len:224 (-),score=32.15 TRINITY_DN26607_c0_g1_i1:76-747(-)